MFTFELMREFSHNLMRFIPGCGPKVYQSEKRIDGQIVVITGANGGIGKETSKELARRGGKVSKNEDINRNIQRKEINELMN